MNQVRVAASVLAMSLAIATTAEAQRARQRRAVPPRVVLLPDAASPDGLPRAGLLHPGARLPVVFATLPAALAALASLEPRA